MHIRTGSHPIEFFIEGTRSRTGKSLSPKLGFLSLVVESFFKNEVYDIMFVPVSISYSKIIEEELYGFELLGFPKPKESTSGLFKARKILNTNYGDAYINFGTPISLRQSTRLTVDRFQLSLKPISLLEANPYEHETFRILGHEIVAIQQENLELNTWPLICAVLLGNLGSDALLAGNVAVADVAEPLQELVKLFELLGCHIRVSKSIPAEEVGYWFRLHSNLFAVDEKSIKLEAAKLNELPKSAAALSSAPLSFLGDAVSIIIVQNYANQCMFWLAPLAFYLLANRSSTGAFESFRFLEKLFNREFVTYWDRTAESFSKSENIIKIQMNRNNAGKLFHLIESLLQPFILGYYLTYRCLLETSHSLTEVKVIDLAQRYFIRAANVDEKVAGFKQLLSNDLHKNALHALNEFGALQKEKRKCQGGTVTNEFQIDRAKVAQIVEKLQEYLSFVPSIPLRSNL